jgi:hypothetical protein
MKVVSLIVGLVLALASGAPAQPAQLPIAGPVAEQAIAGAVDTAGTNDDDATAPAPGPSTYLLLALGLFGMGLVSRRRQAE